jgi:hypothetical protein
MAFQNRSDKKSALSIVETLAVGESLTGYYLGNETVAIEDREAQILKMRINGESVNYFAAGNLKYLVIDGKLVAGQNTRITRNKDGKNKRGAKVSSFTVEQDPSDVVAGMEATAATASSTTTSSSSSSDRSSASTSIGEKLKGLQAAKQGIATSANN